MNEGRDILAEITEAIGAGAALRLCAEFGGTEIYIPGEALLGQKISGVIGLAAAIRLSHAFGGDMIEMPLGIANNDRQRRAAIRAAGASGTLSKPKIARMFKTTLRTVRRVINGNGKNDPDQGRLL